MTKTLKTLLIILGVVAIGGFGVLAFQSLTIKEKPIIGEQVIDELEEESELDEISSWKTYTNKEYNFEIKYPNDWILVFRERPYPGVDTFFGFRRKEITPTFDDYMDIHVMISKQEQPIDYPIKDENYDFIWRITDGEKISVSGIEAYYLKNVNAPILGVDEIYFAYKNNLYRTIAIPLELKEGGEPRNEEHRIMFNKIMSTFKFLD